eukprot:TRINITY_DN7290_c0_g1_i1.p1 TRINITY_DN7290_c0_g1~~TRINITY_DN7290_c0_g1_i1.p1  ORF type:complete len:813 (+),score=159.08 TRINITY_DN7290_c0_g1_i1:358-2439(+)
MNIVDIVSRSPFSLGDGIMYVGTKKNSLYMINSQTGIVSKCILEDENDNCEDRPLSDDIVFLGRADYTVKAIDMDSGTEKWNITYSTYVSESLLYEEYTNPLISNASLISHIERGTLQMLNTNSGTMLWEKTLVSPAIHLHSKAEDISLYFEEYILMGESNVFIAPTKEGSLYALPGGHSAMRPHPILLLGLKFKNEDAVVPYVSHCNVNSPLYPSCLLGMHNLPDKSESDIAMKNDVGGSIPYFYISLAVGFVSLGLLSNYFIKKLKTHTSVESSGTVDQTSPKKKKASKKKKSKKKSEKVKKDDDNEIALIPEEPIVVTDPNSLSVGDLTIYRDKVLGYGSSGTIVYLGEYGSRQVAVKRMLLQLVDVAQKEVDILIESDEHPSVIRYFSKVEDSQFVYLSLSYCPITLQDYVLKGIEEDLKKNLLADLTDGLHHLHKLDIVHRDLKPANVLVTENGRIKISDMGLAKKITDDQSFTTTSTGTYGWQAPEIILGKGSLTKKVDIFSLGCIYFFVLTDGIHPFGENYERQSNIVKGEPVYFDRLGDLVALDLVKKATKTDYQKRPSVEELPLHIYFWNGYRRLDFIRDASSVLEFEDPNGDLVQRYERKNSEIIGNDWKANLHHLLLQDLNRYRKYDETKLRDFLRVVRNKAQHFRDLDPVLQEDLGPLPYGYLDYFTSKFPSFLIYTYNFI